MKRKYYIPDLEEFVPGFEYETFEKVEDPDSNWMHNRPVETEGRWLKCEYPDPFIGWNVETILRVLKDKIRTKYLDEDDLGELNFKRIGDGQFESNSDNYLSLEYFVEDRGWYLTYSENESQFGFGGFIKNKSELERLLKQLNAL